MIGIYKITNLKGRIYIGQSLNIERRKKVYQSSKYFKSQKKLAASILKYGWNTHLFEIIEECAENQLNERERYWQDFYNVLEKGLNCRLTATTDKSGRMSKEARKRMSKAAKGKKREGEWLEKAKICMKKAYNCLKKPVQLYSHLGKLLAEYESLNEAHRQTGFSMTTITKSIKGLTKKNRHGKWKYRDTRNI